MLFFSRKKFIVATSVNLLDGLFDAIKKPDGASTSPPGYIHRNVNFEVPSGPLYLPKQALRCLYLSSENLTQKLLSVKLNLCYPYRPELAKNSIVNRSIHLGIYKRRAQN